MTQDPVALKDRFREAMVPHFPVPTIAEFDKLVTLAFADLDHGQDKGLRNFRIFFEKIKELHLELINKYDIIADKPFYKKPIKAKNTTDYYLRIVSDILSPKSNHNPEYDFYRDNYSQYHYLKLSAIGSLCFTFSSSYLHGTWNDFVEDDKEVLRWNLEKFLVLMIEEFENFSKLQRRLNPRFDD